MANREAAEAAKVDLAAHLRGQPWFRGAGITQAKCLGPNPWEVAARISSRRHLQQVPRVWMGVPVSVAVVGDIVALGDAASVSSKDFGNVLAGAMIAASTFFVGKIAVESIVAHRKETFARKGQPKEAVKAKETTLDGIVKIAACGFGLWRMVNDLPELVKQVEEMSK